MNTHRIRHLVIAATCLALLATACGRSEKSSDGGSGGTETTEVGSGAFIDPAKDCTNYEPTKGIEGSTITVGTVRPAQGPYAIYDVVTKGVEKFFAAANAAGGIKAGDGKTYTVKLLKEDDTYDPAKTPAAVKKLVEQDGVFGLVGQIGTETNLAVRQYVNEKCVPSVALATGSTQWGDAAKYPWFIGGLPSYATEAHRFMEFLNEQKSDATIALLYQNDDFGKAYQSAIKKYIADTGSKMKVVAEQSYDPASGQTTEGVTTQLAQSKADVFFVGLGGTPCPRTLTFMPVDWKPITYVSITCSGKLALSLAGGRDEGVYSTQATLDPATTADQSNPRMQKFFTDGAAQGLTKDDLENGIVSAGWGFAAAFAKALELSPKVTRADVMNTLYSFKDQNYGLLRDDAKASTDQAKDPWLLESLRVVKRKDAQWTEAAPMVDYNGKSNSFAGG